MSARGAREVSRARGGLKTGIGRGGLGGGGHALLQACPDVLLATLLLDARRLDLREALVVERLRVAGRVMAGSVARSRRRGSKPASRGVRKILNRSDARRRAAGHPATDPERRAATDTTPQRS